MKMAGGVPRLWGGLLCVGMGLGAAWAQPAGTVVFSPPAATFADTVTIQLSGAVAGQQIRFVVASGPNAVSAAVTAQSPVYSGPITVQATSLIRAAVFAADGSDSGRTTSGYYLKVNPDVAGFSTRLPVLVLDVLGAGPLEKDEVNHASWLFGFAPDGGPAFSGPADFASALDATVRGSSSAGFPKKGYNVRMRDAAGRGRAFPIFDLSAYERWAFVAPWSFDATFFNNAFMYQLSNRIGRWAPRTKLVEFFFNTSADDLDVGDYGGIYIVTDRVRAEPGRVDVDQLDDDATTEPAITGGYVLQLDPPDEGDISWVTSRGVPEQRPSEIVLVEPDADDITPAQLDYIRTYVQRMEDALHADRDSGFAQRTYLGFIDRSSWVDHHILNVLANNPDALHRSAYFTKPRGGRLQAGPIWDFDRALGGFWDDRTSLVDTWSGVNGAVDVWRTGWWGVLSADPEFIQEWIDRWQTLRALELSNESLTTLAQDLADTVGVEAANRDVARWPDSLSPHGSYPAQIAFLKNWLTLRAQWIDSQFVARPGASSQAGTVTYTPPAGAQLAYTTDGTDPRAVGGAVSTSAILHSGPLSVPAGANIRVRSYDSRPRAQFPASPWSTFADRSRISPAATPGRIVNLSSKASLGQAGDTLIIGFVAQEAASKRFLVRAVGPGLRAFGESAAVDEPRLAVLSATGAKLAENSGWQTDASAAQLPALSASVGAFPLAAGSDAATVVETRAGSHTIQIAADGSPTGSVLGEVYELDAGGRTANVSIRGRATAGQPLTAGFVISGGTNRVLIRAVGPTLRQFGVEDAMADPAITLRAGGVVIASNDSWLSGGSAQVIEDEGARAGAFPLPAGSQDAALVSSLPSGNYTVEVTTAGAGGTVLVEIYDLP